tara:strand:- start:365 stop:511 length:147 start_codon:yes stop_codon:yes gene_type:complete
MKKITLTPKEFILFKNVANMFKIFFTYIVFKGIFIVMANEECLADLGY